MGLSAAKPGAQVTLRFEMETLVVMHTCPHPLNPATEYPKKPVHVEMLKADPVTADDYCLNFRPENGRAFENNRLYYLDEVGEIEPGFKARLEERLPGFVHGVGDEQEEKT